MVERVKDRIDNYVEKITGKTFFKYKILYSWWKPP